MAEACNKEGQLTSAAAFVEGGVQDACDDACSICLDPFCNDNPSTMTCCKHEFHLQCILEWCQRSSQCPMCWQAISLKDPTSQELLEAVESERNIRANRSRDATIFHHPMIGEFNMQRLPFGTSDSAIEERILQHLAVAAAMSRSHHMVRREGQQSRAEIEPWMPGSNPHVPQPGTLLSGDGAAASNTDSRSLCGQSSADNQETAGPSELQSFSESIKSRLNSVSMRYKDSISKSTRGWRERFLPRNASMSDIGTDIRREVNAGIATVSRMIERLDSRANTRSASDSIAESTKGHTAMGTSSSEN